MNGFLPLGNDAYAIVKNGKDIGAVCKGTGNRWQVMSLDMQVMECFEHTPKYAECLETLALG